jgi:ribonuclease VapC
MIVIDSSALLAIHFEEPEGQSFQDIITGSERCIISAVNVHETASVLRLRRGLVAVAGLWEMLRDNEIEIVAFDEVQARAAIEAFDRYGKGINSKARLNISDCAAYALAKTMNCPLLFKGNDFTQTDVQPALH